jgi:hypothetical protein
MTRSLLERAAKAAGLVPDDGNPYDQFYGLSIKREPQGVFTPCYWWNPLTDDADALRLAVKLGIDLGFGFGQDDKVVCVIIDSVPYYAQDGDMNAATRRAIVRAAASMVKE